MQAEGSHAEGALWVRGELKSLAITIGPKIPTVGPGKLTESQVPVRHPHDGREPCAWKLHYKPRYPAQTVGSSLNFAKSPSR